MSDGSEDITIGEFLANALSDPESGSFLVDMRNVADVSRQNDKRPAYIKFWVPDDYVKNLEGNEEKRGYHFYVYVPREWVDAHIDVVVDSE